MRGKVVGAALLVALVAYGTVDALDRLPPGPPGVLTLAEPWERPAPFPDVAPEPVVPDVLADPAGGPAPDDGRAAELTAALAVDPRLGGGVGAVVVDVASGDTLADLDARTPRAPASTVKLLTATAALLTLGPEARLATRVLAAPDLTTDLTAAGVGVGTIHLAGGGDVLLAAGPGEEGAVVGHAGLADLAAATAAELAERGVERVAVRLDDTAYSGPATANGWGPIDLDGGFVAPVAPLAVDRGRLPGQTARDADAALTAARTFAAALAEAGIAVEGEVVRGAAPPGAPEVARVESAPVADLVAYALTRSDNDVAEALARATAAAAGRPGSFEGAAAATLAALSRSGLDVAGVSLADASGLSGEDRVPPATLAHLVGLLTDGAHPELLAAAHGMPVAGLSGTLADRLTAEPSAGVVRAKTGTLVTAVSLAGWTVGESGRVLAFAVVADGVPVGGVGAARDAVDEWVTGLARLP